jgi:FkbM family methyltransferase
MKQILYKYDGSIVTPSEVPEYYGQYELDKIIHEEYFKNRYNGVFVDVGANDGVSINSTLFFERYMKWKGLCIEPNPDSFEFLNRNRDSCLQIAVSDKEGIAEFTSIKGYSNSLSGLTEDYHPLHVSRIHQELQMYGGNKKAIPVQTKPLNTIFAENNITEVNLLKIDTEGSELKILSTLNFNNVKVELVVIENNYDSEEYRTFMKEKGFVLKKRSGIDEIYLNSY